MARIYSDEQEHVVKMRLVEEVRCDKCNKSIPEGSEYFTLTTSNTVINEVELSSTYDLCTNCLKPCLHTFVASTWDDANLIGVFIDINKDVVHLGKNSPALLD